MFSFVIIYNIDLIHRYRFHISVFYFTQLNTFSWERVHRINQRDPLYKKRLRTHALDDSFPFFVHVSNIAIKAKKFWINLTFVCPCIVSIIVNDDQQDATILVYLFIPDQLRRHRLKPVEMIRNKQISQNSCILLVIIYNACSVTLL